MKHFLSLISALTLACLTLTAQEETPRYLPAWQEGYFDIHHISTGEGECQLLIYPDGTQMLIDAGDMSGVGMSWGRTRPLPDSSRTVAQWIARYIDRFAPHPGMVDYALVSHFHPDHIGNHTALKPGPHGYKVCGIMEVGEYVRIGTLVDRGYPYYDFPSEDVVRKRTKSMKEYRQFVDWQTTHGGMKAELFRVGSRKQFGCKSGKWDFEVWNVAGNAHIAKGKKAVPMYTPDLDPNKFDENMFSLVQVFRYGPFRYYSGGDLPGLSTSKRPFFRQYESVVADLIGPCNAIKADHHGNFDTTTPYFLWKMAPDVVVIQAFTLGSPRPAVINRLCDPLLPGQRKIYLSNEQSRQAQGEKNWARISGVGHIVIRVEPGGKHYTVYVLDAKKEDCPLLSETRFNTDRTR